MAEQNDKSEIYKIVVESGAFDELRKKVVEELKRDPTLKEYAKEQMLNSQAWKDAQSSDRKDRRALLEAANKELQKALMEKASRRLWEQLTAKDGKIATEIDTKVHEAACEALKRRRKQHHETSATAGGSHTIATSTGNQHSQRPGGMGGTSAIHAAGSQRMPPAKLPRR